MTTAKPIASFNISVFAVHFATRPSPAIHRTNERIAARLRLHVQVGKISPEILLKGC